MVISMAGDVMTDRGGFCRWGMCSAVGNDLDIDGWRGKVLRGMMLKTHIASVWPT